MQCTEQNVHHRSTGFLFSRVFGVRMGKSANLSEFVKGQIVMAQRFGTLLSRKQHTLLVVHMSLWCVCIKSGARMAKPQTVVRPCVIRSSLMPAESALFTTVPQITSSYKSVNKCVTAHSPSQSSAYGSVQPYIQPGPHAITNNAWAQDHQEWTVEDWKKVAWSDESRLLMFDA